MSRRRGLLSVQYLGLGAALAVAAPARADEGFRATSVGEPEKVAPEGDPFRTKPGYVQLFGTLMVGTGLRFNNPYRLATPLGDDAESLSRTATYADFGFGVTFGNPLGVQHGLALRISTAMEGVGQVVTTPSYFVWRRWHSLAAFGRLGLPVVLTPSPTWGFEASVGGAWFFTGGIGIAAEMVGDIIYGAGTADVSAATYPLLSGQLGLITTLEVLP
ncbi:MAG: hypothetical protein JST00_23390 [Deltaproteobacteria bacterium]|nr:hypothetical protein [Deltaproteobacteria bacterium]